VQKEFDHAVGDFRTGAILGGAVTAALLGLNERTFRRRRQNLRIRRHFDFRVGVQSSGDHYSCEPSEPADGVPNVQYEAKTAGDAAEVQY
jgi:hypothetical protein